MVPDYFQENLKVFFPFDPICWREEVLQHPQVVTTLPSSSTASMQLARNFCRWVCGRWWGTLFKDLNQRVEYRKTMEFFIKTK